MNFLDKLYLFDLFRFAALSTIGYLITNHEIILNFSKSLSYEYLINFFLSIGLYASVSSINISSLKVNQALIIKSVTIGVILKIIIISLLMYCIFSGPFLEPLLLAIIVAQIDPLSVAALIKKEEHILSERANTIIRAWSSFDDPITAIFAMVIAVYLTFSGNPNFTLVTNMTIATIVSVLIFLFALVLYKKKKLNNKTKISRFLQIFFFVIFLLLGTFFQEFFLIAAAGLFIRPRGILNIVNRILPYVYYCSIILMGMKLVNGIDIYHAFALALAAVFSQVIVGCIMTSSLSAQDRWFICFSQQNGLTAIILALLLLKFDPNLIMIVAPAIFIINLLHIISNTVIRELVVHDQ